MDETGRRLRSAIVDGVSDERAPARFLLAIGTVAGLSTVVFYLVFRPDPANTFDVFYAAANQSFGGQVDYRTGRGLYVYTPVVLYFFYPYTLLDFATALLVHRIVSVIVAFGYGLLLVRFLRARTGLTATDSFLIVAFTAASLHPVVIVVLGGVEILLGFCLGVGFLLLEADRDHEGGALWALASLVKVFPAAWGAYLLRLRRWRAVGAAMAVGIGATAVGILTFGPDAYLRYVRSTSSDRIRVDAFAGGVSPDNEAVTPIRPLAQLFPELDPHVWPPIVAAVIVLVVVLGYFLVPTNGLDDRAILLLLTLIGVTLALPTSQDMDMYLIYGPLIVLVYVERYRATKLLIAAGGLIMTLNVGRGEVRAISSVLGEGLQQGVLAVTEPILAFASMPLYGLTILLGACLLHCWRRGREAGRLDAVRARLQA